MRFGFGFDIAQPRGGGGAAFSPAALFAAGEEGVWYDPSDLTTLYQDHLGTIPAAYGQPVGLMLDKSGRGNHASQPTVTARPTLMQDAGGRAYLQFDGVDDALFTSAFDWGGNKATITAGVRKLSDEVVGVIAEFSASLSNQGSFSLAGPASGKSATYRFATFSSTLLNVISQSAYPTPSTNVISGFGDTVGGTATHRVDGQGQSLSGNQGGGNFGMYPLYIGARSRTSLFFNGRLYSLAAINRLLSPDDLGKLEAYTAQKTGVTL